MCRVLISGHGGGSGHSSSGHGGGGSGFSGGAVSSYSSYGTVTDSSQTARYPTFSSQTTDYTRDSSQTADYSRHSSQTADYSQRRPRSGLTTTTDGGYRDTGTGHGRPSPDRQYDQSLEFGPQTVNGQSYPAPENGKGQSYSGSQTGNGQGYSGTHTAIGQNYSGPQTANRLATNSQTYFAPQANTGRVTSHQSVGKTSNTITSAGVFFPAQQSPVRWADSSRTSLQHPAMDLQAQVIALLGQALALRVPAMALRVPAMALRDLVSGQLVPP